MKPKISVLLCTYNNKNDVSNCLRSILVQSERSFEVLCIDGGSVDGTREYIDELSGQDSRIKVVHNKNRLPEGYGNGKWLGFRKAKGNIICIIDQDNVLQDRFVFTKAINALKAEENAFGVLAGLTNDKNDSLVVRYVSLVGTDSFFAYRSVDFLRQFKHVQKKRGYDVLRFDKQHVWITGGNCFFYRREDVKRIGGYDQDRTVVPKLVASGMDELAIIPDATKHYAERSLTSLVLKKFKWGKAYFKKKKDDFSYLSGAKDKLLFTLNFLAAITVVPYFIFSLYLLAKVKDPVILLFAPHAFLTTVAYALAGIKSKITG